MEKEIFKKGIVKLVFSEIFSVVKWFLIVFCLFSLRGWSQTPTEENELFLIDQKIQILKDRLHEEHMKEMEEEVRGQGLMIGDWEAFGKDIQKIHKQEEEEKKIQLEIQQLEQRKSQLKQKMQ